MANMSYCRFENTYSDLLDASEHMDEEDDLSESESQARERLIQLCCDIADGWGRDV